MMAAGRNAPLPENLIAAGRHPGNAQGWLHPGCVGDVTFASSTIPRMAERDRIAEFKEVAELMPDDPVVRFGLAGAYLDAGKPENAAEEYREAIRLKPDYSAAHRGLGRALERAGQIAEARVAYQQGLEVATRTGDLQTGKEIEVFLRRLEKAAG
jgi:predicted Zn-dependent protease